MQFELKPNHYLIIALKTFLSIIMLQTLPPEVTTAAADLLSAWPMTASGPNASQTKYLNVACDFSGIGGGGCVLRESYCSYHTCVCKPDFPVNVDDVMCIDRHKKVGEICTIDNECETNSYCVKAQDNFKLKRCVCRQGFSFSRRNNSCIRGHQGSLCSTGADCSGTHSMCSQSKCQCDYGYDWVTTDEKCYKKSRLNESCESTLNCRVYDRLSECDRVHKVCVCRPSIAEVNAIDEIRQKCVICPLHRYINATKVCKPETIEIDYSSSDRSVMTRHSLQYVYIALSISPFVVFAIIGFLYKFVSPRSHSLNNLLNNRQMHSRHVFTDEPDCQPQTTARNDTNHPSMTVLTVNDSRPLVCPPISPALMSLIPPRDPPPSYEASQLMPPSYEEAIAASQPSLLSDTH